MKTIYSELAERFRGEVEDIEPVVQRTLYAWKQAKTSTADQDIYLDSVALNLHGFYSGLERLFELVARHLDHNLPSSETWHKDLLEAMGHEVADIRPALIAQDNAETLDEFRRFRHLVRNVYTTNLVPGKIAGLLEVLPGLWSRLKDELIAFADFLESQADL